MLKEHCSEMIFNKTIGEEMRWSIKKQTVGFTHSPHPGLNCFHTLYLSVCTVVTEVWPESRKSTSYLTHILFVLKHSPRVSLKLSVAVGPVASNSLSHRRRGYMGDHWKPYSLCNGSIHQTHSGQSTPHTSQIGRLDCRETGGAHIGHSNWKVPNTAHPFSPIALQ
jgi:hypothetical protein